MATQDVQLVKYRPSAGNEGTVELGHINPMVQQQPPSSRPQGSRSQTNSKSLSDALSTFFYGKPEESSRNHWRMRSQILQARSVCGGGVRCAVDAGAGATEGTTNAGDIEDETDATILRSRRVAPASARQMSYRHCPTRDCKEVKKHSALHNLMTHVTGKTAHRKKPGKTYRSFAPMVVHDHKEMEKMMLSSGDLDFFTSATPGAWREGDTASTHPGADYKLSPNELPQQPLEPHQLPKISFGTDDEGPYQLPKPRIFTILKQRDSDSGARLLPEDDVDAFSFTEAVTVVKEEFEFTSNRKRAIGQGFVGRFCGTELKDEEELPPEIQKQINSMVEYRPYFTFWVTLVQIGIYIFSCAAYGIAPIGVDKTPIEGEVLMPNLAVQKQSYLEYANMWIGPRQADLIHLGAKYSPCMRRDHNIIALHNELVQFEAETACCVRNDGSGCMQIASDGCSRFLSYWHKWSEASPGPESRVSGSVCGQDPRYCLSPASSAPFQWKDNITQWPVCQNSSTAPNTRENIHMNCQLTARPCCIGIQGECVITSQEHCDFLRGYFHEEATLCSQVSCMSETCGMIRFYDPQQPDQFYRLWISLFLHAGLFPLLATIVFQLFVMRDIEKLAGWHRTAFIYIFSGIAGSLASCIFLPYYVEAGPAGSQLAILACLMVEVIQNWQIIKKPWWALGKQLIFNGVLILMGFLPYIDNYAHLVGFLCGFLLAFALLPHINFNVQDKTFKTVGIVLCLLCVVGLFVALSVLFYVAPFYECPNCHYFTCIPFTPTLCENMKVEVKKTVVMM